jgi:hypothetical protein
MARLCFSKSMIRQVASLVEEERFLAGYDSAWSDGDLRRLVRRAGAENLESLVALRTANLVGSAKGRLKPLLLLNEFQKRVRDLIKSSLIRGPQDLVINGADVMKIRGLSPGPEVGRILKRLSEDLMDHPEWNKRSKLLAMVKKMKLPESSEYSEVLSGLHGAAGRLKTRAQPKP